jgi:hypothetical protein
VFSEIDGVHASTVQAGQKLYEFIEPAVARGEEVVLDFEGAEHFAPSFFNYTIGRFVERDADDLHGAGRAAEHVVRDAGRPIELCPEGKPVKQLIG